jgi:hypothetical protein
MMDVEHDGHRVGFRLVEDFAQHGHHEVSGGVVVVMKEDPVQLRTLHPLLGLHLRDGQRPWRALSHPPAR